MSKELTPLEALERIKYYVAQVMNRDKEIANSELLKSICNFNKECSFIEKALKRLDTIDNIFAKYNVLNEYHLEEKLELVKDLMMIKL